LGQFVISEKEMKSLGKLALERRDEINQLVGFVAAVGIGERAVDDFLKDQMPAREFSKVRKHKYSSQVL
jgi:hypothetical protein